MKEMYLVIGKLAITKQEWFLIQYDIKEKLYRMRVEEFMEKTDESKRRNKASSRI